MHEHQVTGFAGVPSTFALMMHRSNLDTAALPSLRYVTQAGGGMPPARISEWLQRGPRADFFVMYGATEASARLTYLPPALLRGKLGSIGRAIPDVEIRVIREDGTEAPRGEVGELVARGPNISSGYWNNPQETAHRFGPLGYRTGDLGYQDADGDFYLVGRLHDMIKVGANRVGVKEIEDVLHEHPAVHEAAVVGTAHEMLGEVPVAFVALRDEIADAENTLRAFCAARLAAYKVPLRVIIRRELPKLPGAGKIDRPSLRAAASKLESDPTDRLVHDRDVRPFTRGAAQSASRLGGNGRAVRHAIAGVCVVPVRGRESLRRTAVAHRSGTHRVARSRGLPHWSKRLTDDGTRMTLLGTSRLFEPSDWLCADAATARALADQALKVGPPLLLQRVPTTSCAVRAAVRASVRPASRSRGWPPPHWPSTPVARGRRTLRASPPVSLRGWPDCGEKPSARSAGSSSNQWRSSRPTLNRRSSASRQLEATGWKAREGSALGQQRQLFDFYRRYGRRAAAAGTLRVSTLLFGSQTRSHGNRRRRVQPEVAAEDCV